MATTSAYNAVDSGIQNSVSGGTVSSAGGKDVPRFGMQKGCRIQPGQILWQGRYVDQNQFYRVSHIDAH